MPSASTRAVTSAEVPAGNRTTNSIGFLPGNASCAGAGQASSNAASGSNRRAVPRRARMDGLLVSVGAAERVMAAHVAAVALLRIAVHQRTRVQRVGKASYLMLDREQRPAVSRIDEVAEAVLVLIALLRDKPPLMQQPVRPGEVADVDLDVVPVVVRRRARGLAEAQLLSRTSGDDRHCFCSSLEPRVRAEDLLIEARDPGGTARRDAEFHVGNGQLGGAEFGSGGVTAIAIAPRTRRFDNAVALLPGKTRLREQGRDFLQPALERGKIGHDDPHVAAQHLSAADRKSTRLNSSHLGI